MTEASKQWEGQIVEGIFPLRQYLGGSDHSAVFLTEYSEGGQQKAAIKLFPADSATADLQIASWEFAAQLAHPNLLRLFRGGRCRIEGNDLLFLVMEYAEEDLADILPQRALTPEETRDMLGPVLDALEYLHGKGFVHGDLKPANILATGDHLKLSTDAISRVGESQGGSRRVDAYDPPEAISGILTPAADVWSLGMTLVEVLTQHLPEWQPGTNRDPVVPPNLPAPYMEIARQCLRLEPQRRVNVVDIATRLNARVAVAAASVAGSVSSVSSSLGPGALTGQHQTSVGSPRSMPSMPASPGTAPQVQIGAHEAPPHKVSGARSWFLVPLIVGAVAFVAILTVPRLLTHRADTQNPPNVPSEKRSSQSAVSNPAEPVDSSKPKTKPEPEPAISQTAKSSAPAAQQMRQPTPSPPAPDTLKPTSDKELATSAASTAKAAASEELVKPASVGTGSGRGEVLDQILPDVSPKARGTIQGKVRVSVKVHVDSAGSVSGAELDSAGPSSFFAELALQAARKWAFTPPEVDGKSVASEWRLRFEFTQKDTKVIPAQTAP
jgi:TonB family protein